MSAAQDPGTVGMETCEWCACLATTRYAVTADREIYERFACRAHHNKTGRLVLLDGHKEETITVTSQSSGFKQDKR